MREKVIKTGVCWRRLSREALAQIKFFISDAQWTWYASEYDGEDIFFGLVIGLEIELGYFSLSELKSVKGLLSLPIEQNLHFKPKSLQELMDKHRSDRGEWGKYPSWFSGTALIIIEWLWRLFPQDQSLTSIFAIIVPWSLRCEMLCDLLWLKILVRYSQVWVYQAHWLKEPLNIDVIPLRKTKKKNASLGLTGKTPYLAECLFVFQLLSFHSW